ncbi:hypothetical protein TanjilG_07436 [Lupinus angustifolius]|uniref:Uncharacterized protein n=1 Tax=Lupinus angustifolius TaxID=3871 RepID=A0A4P1QUP0_LUPAN|nr:hypothetical protein TanjilG_07436 [Lupinus angustifolius]
MTLLAIFLTATKLAGAVVTLTVAANAFSFSRFRNKNLRTFRSPINDSDDTLADFNVTGTNYEINLTLSLMFHSPLKSQILMILIIYKHIHCRVKC